MLENTPNQPTKFRTKNWVEIDDDARRMYNTNIQIKFKTSMLRSSLCDYSDAYILVKRTISITALAEDNLNNANKKAAYKNFAPFTDCISESKNTQTDNAKYND